MGCEKSVFGTYMGGEGDFMVERGGCAPDRLCPGREVRCELCLEGFGMIR